MIINSKQLQLKFLQVFLIFNAFCLVICSFFSVNIFTGHLLDF